MLLDRRRRRPVRGVRVVTRESAPFGLQVVPLRMLSVDEVQRTLDRLPEHDGPVVTSALNPIELHAFAQVGFVEREALHLLRHDLRDIPPADHDVVIRNARRSDLHTVLEIDRACFDEFWRLDRAGLLAARRATPVHTYRVALDGRRVIGYVVTGQSGSLSYLQRLAVDPDHRGRRVGSELVFDSMRWAVERRCSTMMVNTQVSNDGALGLYQALGFQLDREQLKVLEWPR